MVAMYRKGSMVVWILAISAFLSCKGRQPANPLALVRTEMGDIIIEIYPDRAPITAGNFLRYIDENRYSDAAFYRVVRSDNQPDNSIKIEVIQGGIGFMASHQRRPPILHETTKKTGMLHRDGVVSMARAEPGTASSEFFICIGDQPELDFGGRRNPDGQGFAAFGQVKQGMDVVQAIHKQPAHGQMLVKPVKIIRIERLKTR
jgi:peptidyl-prolyl cis-trans isomerase A (cyclophilin A)